MWLIADVGSDKEFDMVLRAQIVDYKVPDSNIEDGVEFEMWVGNKLMTTTSFRPRTSYHATNTRADKNRMSLEPR